MIVAVIVEGLFIVLLAVMFLHCRGLMIAAHQRCDEMVVAFNDLTKFVNDMLGFQNPAIIRLSPVNLAEEGLDAVKDVKAG